MPLEEYHENTIAVITGEDGRRNVLKVLLMVI